MGSIRKLVKQKIIKSLIVGFTFLFIFGATFTINKMYIKKNTDLIDVVAAAVKVGAYSPLSTQDLKMAKVPRGAVPDSAVTDLKSLLGQKRYFAGDLGFGEGDIIRWDRLFNADQNPLGSLTRLAAEDKMLVSVNTNLVKSTANLVVPGTLVNAVVFIKGDLVNAPDRILSSVEDPRLGNLLVVDKKNAEADIPADKGRDAIPSVITVMLEQKNMAAAKALVEYNEKGSIYLLPIGFRGDIHLAARQR